MIYHLVGVAVNTLHYPFFTMTDPIIGTLAEKSLHAKLKWLFANDGDLFEQAVDGYVIDVVKADRLVEIQTGNFGGMKKKLGHCCRRMKSNWFTPSPRKNGLCGRMETAVFSPVANPPSGGDGKIYSPK
jgi:hypothetical protein